VRGGLGSGQCAGAASQGESERTESSSSTYRSMTDGSWASDSPSLAAEVSASRRRLRRYTSCLMCAGSLTDSGASGKRRPSTAILEPTALKAAVATVAGSMSC
jgi:hypothetical protein